MDCPTHSSKIPTHSKLSGSSHHPVMKTRFNYSRFAISPLASYSFSHHLQNSPSNISMQSWKWTNLYLKDLLTPYTPTRNLRSANKDTLVIPKVTTKAYGQRSYQFAAPHLWNNLPLHIKQATTISSFKTLLKTYLFKSSYT